MSFQITLAERTARILVKTKITPNQVSWVGTILFFTSAWMFSLGTHAFSILGVGIFHVSLIFNRVDGFMARKKKFVTKYGIWLNDIFDDIRYPVIIVGIAAATPTFMLLACAGIFCYMYHKIILNHGMFRKYDYMHGKSFEFKLPTVISPAFESISGIIMRYSMVAFAFLNVMESYVLIFSAYSVIYCLLTFFIYDSRIRSENAVIK